MTSQPCPRATEADAPGMPAADGLSAFHREPDVVLYHAHALDVLARLPEKSVHCVVTSPPYWLRDYHTTTSGGPAALSTTPSPGGDRAADAGPAGGPTGEDGQHGREATATAYVDRLREVFTHLARVLVADGTAWLNLGDSYAANSDGYRRSHPGQPQQPGYRPASGLPVKNLIGMPWQVAFALQADGWIVRNAAVWHKPNATGTPVADQLACRYEWLFLLTRKQRYFFDLDAIRVPYAGDRSLSRRAHHAGRKPHTARGSWPPPIPEGHPVPGRNPGDVWTIAARGDPQHPAAFPITLPLRAITAGCPPCGVVLDPFTGSGTTLLAARQLGRRAIGMDLDRRSCEITARRLAVTAGNQHPMARHGPASAPADPPPQRSRNETP